MPENRVFYSLEPFILYAVLYFPALFPSKTHSSPADIYNSNSILLYYFIISLIQISFVLYFILSRKELYSNGIKKLNLNIIPLVLLYLIMLLAIAVTANLILDLILPRSTMTVDRSGIFIIKASVVALLTGYREEIFFRAYFISSSEKQYGKFFAAAASSVLFSISHLSGGIRAVVTALSAGFFLSYVFIKHRNFHINSLTHSLYNFCVLILSF